MWRKLHFFEVSHIFRALLSGNVAQVQVLIDGRLHIPLWTIAVLCNSSYKSCSFNIKCSSTVNWNIISTETDCVIPSGYKQDISIRLCDGLLLEYTDGTASRVTNLLNISTTCWKTPRSFLTFLTEIGLVDGLRLISASFN